MSDGEPIEGAEEGDEVEDFTGSSDLSGDVDAASSSSSGRRGWSVGSHVVVVAAAAA